MNPDDRDAADQPGTARLPVPEADVLNGARGELAERCGIRITGWDGARLTGTMPVEGNRQPFGLLHGGASGVLAETLGSVHANLLAGPDHIAVGIELSCTHHRSATSGVVTGVSSALHAGRTLVTLQIAIADDAGRSVCTARLTCMLRARTAVPSPPAPPQAGGRRRLDKAQATPR